MDVFVLGWVDDGLIDLGQSIKDEKISYICLIYKKVILKVTLSLGPFSILKSFFIYKCCLLVKENGF
jgi:hypothetical protein